MSVTLFKARPEFLHNIGNVSISEAVRADGCRANDEVRYRYED
jgi:hypothetical protein